MNVVRPETVSQAALDALARAVPYSTDGTGQLADFIKGKTVFEIHDKGRVVGAFALSLYAGGKALKCNAAGSIGGGVCTYPVMLDFCEKLAVELGVKVMTFTTQRRGLVRLIEKAGFEIGGYVMRKKL